MYLRIAAFVVATTAAVFAARAASQIEVGAGHYREQCALCHGADGRGGVGFQTPIIGPGNLLAKFGNAQGLFEYNQLLMPFDEPGKMTDDQKWAVVAYLMHRNGWLPADVALGSANAAGIAITGR
jgi:mono/diheme cytochrome c family protein